MDVALLILTCLTTLILGIVVFFRNSTKRHTQLFMMMCIIITIWVISNYATNHSVHNITLLKNANWIAYLSGYGIVISALIFTYYFPFRRQVPRKEKILLTTIALITAGLSATPLIAGEVIVIDGSVLFEEGPLIYLYLASFLLALGFIGRNLVYLPANASNQIRGQAKLILFAFITTAVTGLTFNVIIPVILKNSWDFTRLGPVSTVLLVSIIAYTIIKHGLFDIRTAIVRTVTYTMTIITVLVAYGLLFLFGLTSFLGFKDINLTQQIALLSVASVIGASLPFIVSFFDRITSRVFYRQTYDTQSALDTITGLMVQVNTLDQLLEKVAASLQRYVGSESITVTMTSTRVAQHIAYTTREGEAAVGVPTMTLASMLANQQAVLVIDEVEDDSVAHEMHENSIAMVSQLRSQSGLVGYVLFGYKENGSSYSQRDVDFLRIVSKEFAIAIQSMLRLQEITNFNKELQQRIDEATTELRDTNEKLHEIDKSKDEFISMASHQLRTPLTSVKGYISMVLEGDIGPITDKQRQVLEQAFDSSQRMVFLIGDFLNVSRMQTGKFELELSELDIAQVVNEEVDQLKDTARSKHIQLEYTKPSQIPTIKGDENKLRQVMMNFIDNALYYSPAGTPVQVQLLKDADAIMFKVIDSGIGVPKSEQPHLFTKFYRATNARQQRPDGTGIGLYMAKKVILAHGGTVMFSTEEGKGSTFGFRLPLVAVKK